MVERLNMHPDVIEAQLAHGKSGPLGAAYDRAQFMEQRRQMMNEWAMLRRYTAIKPEDVHAAINKPASPAPDKAGHQGDSQGGKSATAV